MGTKGREIVGMDVDQVVELLNKAFADEWLARHLSRGSVPEAKP